MTGGASLTALPAASTTDLVAGRIREAIIDGLFAPGDHLVEADLAARFRTSRGPVREAIRVLGAERFVVLRKNRGAVVAMPTLDDVEEVYAIRETLGSLAIEHALADGGPSHPQLDVVRRRLARLRDPRVQARPAAMVEADLAFQAALLRLGRLPRISAILEQTHQEVRMFISALGIHYEVAAHRQLIARHEGLLAAVERRDIEGAKRAWRDHIRATVSEFAASRGDGEAR
jgi:DNA-binding GntR family transcriptional regulator